MTLREEFEKYVDGWNNLSVEKLFKSSNKEYIKWLEDRYENDCECKELDDYSEWEIVEHLKSESYDFTEEISTLELVNHLESCGFTVIKGEYVADDVEYVDHNDLIKLDEIRTKFLNSSWSEREKIYNQVVKEEPKSLDEFNNVDMFYHLDGQSFDFLDHIDTQEIISHVEMVGYKVIPE